jgi:hypothetical protein
MEFLNYVLIIRTCIIIIILNTFIVNLIYISSLSIIFELNIRNTVWTHLLCKIAICNEALGSCHYTAFTLKRQSTERFKQTASGDSDSHEDNREIPRLL